MIGHKILGKLPLTGMSRELAILGLSWLNDLLPEDSVENEDIAYLLANALETLNEKAKHPSSKLGRNDSNSYKKTLSSWLDDQAISLPATYCELMGFIINKTKDLLKNDHFNANESLTTLEVKSKGVFLGIAVSEEYAILPAILKQPEFYEKQTTYMKVTTGRKAVIRLDPLWFSIFAMGFLTAYAGYMGGSYYLITKSGMEDYLLSELNDVVRNGLIGLTTANIDSESRIDNEELYELKMASWLADKKILNEKTMMCLYPVRLHVIGIAGNVYTEKKTIDIDLREVQGYFQQYSDKIKALGIAGIKTKAATYSTPLQALIDLAEKQLRSNIAGDNEMLTFIFVKELHRAISSGNQKLLEEAIFRLFRQVNGLMQSETQNVNRYFLMVMRSIMNSTHLQAMLLEN